MDNQCQEPNLGPILQSIGELKGETNANFKGLFDQLLLLRADIQAVERRGQERVDALSAHMDRRFTDVDHRISTLESDNKQQISDIAKQSAIGGGVAAMLISAAVEIIKRI